MSDLRGQVSELKAKVEAFKASNGLSTEVGESLRSPTNLDRYAARLFCQRKPPPPFPSRCATVTTRPYRQILERRAEGVQDRGCQPRAAQGAWTRLPPLCPTHNALIWTSWIGWQLFSEMVGGGVKAQREIRVLKSQVATLKKRTGSGPATAPASRGASTAKTSSSGLNGVLRTAIGLQTPSQKMAVALALNTFVNALDNVFSTYLCAGYSMDDATACDGVTMQKYQDANGKKSERFKLFDKGQYYADNSFNEKGKGAEKSRDLGERQAFKRTRKGFTCATRTSSRADAMQSCKYPHLTPSQRMADDHAATGEWDAWVDKIGAAGMRKVLEASRSLGESTGANDASGFFKKIGKAIKKGAAATFKNLAKKVVPSIARAAMGMSRKQYTCMCSGYLGQFIHKDRGWVVAPGFRKATITGKQGSEWHNTDFGKDGIFFSVLKVPRKDAILSNPKTDRPMCKYDVKVLFQNCYQPNKKATSTQPLTLNPPAANAWLTFHSPFEVRISLCCRDTVP